MCGGGVAHVFRNTPHRMRTHWPQAPNAWSPNDVGTHLWVGTFIMVQSAATKLEYQYVETLCGAMEHSKPVPIPIELFSALI